MKKWMKALALMVAASMMCSVAFAEDEPLPEDPLAGLEEVEASAEEEELPTETAAPTEEEAEAETSADEEAVADTEVTEETEDEVEEVEIVIEIEDEETPLGLPSASGSAQGSVSIELAQEGDIYFGDKLTLQARVSDVTSDYSLQWEVDRQEGEGWEAITGETDDEYEFIVTEENVDYEYRVLLIAE